MCSIDLTYGIEGWGEIVPVQGNGKVVFITLNLTEDKLTNSKSFPIQFCMKLTV